MKYLNNDGYATHPLNLKLSLKKLRDLLPELTGLRGLVYGLRCLILRKPNALEILKEHVYYTDSQPAVVVKVAPLLVAVYSIDLDCVAILKFPEKFVSQYALQVGSKLISMNTYMRADKYQKDLIPGPQREFLWTGFHPVIAEFVSDNLRVIEDRKASIDEESWDYVYDLGVDYVNTFPGVWRDGRPFYARLPRHEIGQNTTFESAI